MNVLYLTENPNRASSNVPVEGWFEHLRPRGLHPVLASPTEGAFQAWARSESVPTHVTPFGVPDRARLGGYAAVLWRLATIVRRHQISVVHAIEHTVYPLAADLARLCRLPVVVGVHCRVDRGFGTWAFGRWRSPDLLFFLTEGSQRVCAPAVEGVVPRSAWRVLYNGLDVARFNPDIEAGSRFRAEHGLGDEPLIGAASWLRPGKQLEHLFAAARDVVAAAGAKVVIAGGVAPGEEEYARTVLRTGQEMLGDRLTYVGRLDDLRGFYNALDFYVNTSAEETCSISIIEAQASGCPVIGYPSVSVDEQVLPLGGEIVPQDDIRRLEGGIRRWLAKPEQLRAMRTGARQQAVERFDIRLLADRLWAAYGEVTN